MLAEAVNLIQFQHEMLHFHVDWLTIAVLGDKGGVVLRIDLDAVLESVLVGWQLSWSELNHRYWRLFDHVWSIRVN